MPGYFSKEFFICFLNRCYVKGLPRFAARRLRRELQRAFERASPDDTVEAVFDQVIDQALLNVSVFKKPGENKLEAKSEAKANVNAESVDVYEDLRKRMGWASDEEIKVQAAIQVAEFKLSEGFWDWLHLASERYKEQLKQVGEILNEDLRKKAFDAFIDAFLPSIEFTRDPDDDGPVPHLRALNETHEVWRAHVPIDMCSLFVDEVYSPSNTFAVDQRMHTSFTNRLKGVDWDYYLQTD